MPRLLTQNLAHYDDESHGPWPPRLEAIARIVAEARPDVLALQEVRFTPANPSTRASYRDMAEQLLVRLAELRPEYRDATVVTHAAMHHPDEGPRVPSLHPPRGREGLSVISRLPVLETGARSLTRAPGCEDVNRRIVQHVAVMTARGPFHVFNAHFALPSDDPTRPCVQANVSETLEYVRRRAEGPFALLGDLNVEPDEPHLERFRDAGLVDAWSLKHPHDPGHTWNVTHAKGPTKRFDYVWVPASLAPRVRDAWQVNVGPVEGTHGSDHRGVAASLDL